MIINPINKDLTDLESFIIMSEAPLLNTVFLSARYKPLPELYKHLPPITPADNCKHAPAIADSIARRTESRNKKIVQEPLLTYIDRLAICPVTSGEDEGDSFEVLCYSFDSDKPEETKQKLLSILELINKTCSTSGYCSGRHIKRLLYTFLYQLAAHNISVGPPMWFLLNWHQDPVDILLDRSSSEYITPELLYKRMMPDLGVTEPYQLWEDGRYAWDYDMDSETTDAPLNLVRDLWFCKRFGFFGDVSKRFSAVGLDIVQKEL